jgi:inorganic pyrophosphatase
MTNQKLYATSKSLELAKAFLGKTVKVVIDRPLGSLHPRERFSYEANYGYVPSTQAPDGAELDAYYLGVEEALAEAEGVCIAIIHRLSDDDDKLVVVPNGVTLSDQDISRAVAFQEQWFEHRVIRLGQDA